MMKFYKENEINPFASCLPLVAQIPVFIGLFYTLRTRLRADICPHLQPHHFVHGHWVINESKTVACGAHNGAGFLFIHDLTTTATGVTLVVLILLYVGTQIVSSLMMQAPTMDKTQQRMMLLLPLFFVIFIIRFPAGLIVYWITTNAWTMGQQYVIRRMIGPVTPVPVPGTAAPGGDGRAPSPVPNGAGSGGLAGLLRGRDKAKEKEPAAVGSSSRSRREAPPPPPPRKKKKRSGRRR
jgi:YidC/Oxa1 family membrane protein insertase